MVEVFHWNPRVKLFRKKPLNWLPFTKPINNFGDLIGPMVVERLLEKEGLVNPVDSDKRLLSVGSIMHFANEGNTVWGSGVLGNATLDEYHFQSLDVRAVRGPKTRAFLQENFSIDAPEVYGDPALLVPLLFPEIQKNAKHKNRFPLTVVPHFHEFRECQRKQDLLNPQSPIMSVLDRIARSDFVVASSLHAVILAEAFGVPAQLYQSKTEHRFKYEDYYLATGREAFRMASSIEEAIQFGGEPPMKFDSQPLLNAFPRDLFN